MRLIFGDIRQPVLIVGAGQGLIVEELRCQGLRKCAPHLRSLLLGRGRLSRGIVSRCTTGIHEMRSDTRVPGDQLQYIVGIRHKVRDPYFEVAASSSSGARLV